MAKYIKPMIDVLYFEEEDSIVTASRIEEEITGSADGQYSAYLLNQHIFYDREAASKESNGGTVTVDVRNLTIRN